MMLLELLKDLKHKGLAMSSLRVAVPSYAHNPSKFQTVTPKMLLQRNSLMPTETENDAY